MRNLVALAALLAFLPVANAADGKADFNANAEYRIRYQMDQNQGTDANDKTNSTEQTMRHRFKLDMGFRSGEKFGAQLTLLHNSILGDSQATNSSSNQEKNGIANNSNMALVNQAYGTWMINDAWSLKFGRGGFTLADGSVISQNDWQATPYSFDGVLVNWEHEFLRLNLFQVKAVDNFTNAAVIGTTNNDDPEVNFYGLAVDLKNLPEFLKMVNLHFMKITGNRTAATTGRDEMRYGVAINGDIAGIDYKLDYAAHDGETKGANAAALDKAGSMYQAEVGYSLPEVMKSRFYVGYHMDTGNKASTAKDEGYDTFFYEKHCGSGCMDVVAWGNLTFLKAGYTLSPMDQVDVGLHYWKFERSEASATNGAPPTAGLNAGQQASGAAGIGTGHILNGTGTSKDLGSEWNLAVTKKYDNGFAVTAWYGMFEPGAYLTKDKNEEDTYNQFFVEGKMTF